MVYGNEVFFYQRAFDGILWYMKMILFFIRFPCRRFRREVLKNASWVEVGRVTSRLKRRQGNFKNFAHTEKI